MPTDYEAEYNNRDRVPEHPHILARMAQEAQAYRAAALARAHAELNLRYGSSERQIVDLFRSEAGDSALAMFIHGGYWRTLEPAAFSQLAAGPTARRIDVALAGYDLCPRVTLAQIVEEMRQACLFLWQRLRKRILVFGHSAGGHLAAAMLATDWQKLGAPADLVPVALSISGLFDLRPLVHTSMNSDLRLDDAEARRLSPLYWQAPVGRAFDAVVGGAESSEFLRQSRTIVDAWGKAGVATRYEAPAGANHFTVIEPLTDAGSALVGRLVELAAKTR